MASKNYRPKQAVMTRLTKSMFGSHAEMINTKAMDKIAELEIPTTRVVDFGTHKTNKEFVVLTDEYGDYITDRDQLDTGLADPNRHNDFVVIEGATSISRANYELRQAKVDSLVGSLEDDEETQD